MQTISEDKIRVIFGLKVAQQRSRLGISLSQLSKKSGLSASYLNEIEKGKKYPKAEKIYALASALDLDYDELVSMKLKQDLAPLGELLASRFFDEIPFDLFGLEGNQIIDLLSKSPMQASAFMGAFIELARQYNIREKELHAAALRSYQELSNNYFAEIEQEAKKFLKKHKLDPREPQFYQGLESILQSTYHYRIDRESLSTDEDLKGVKSFYKAQDEEVLFLESSLSPLQQQFIIAKELGINHLGLDKSSRVNTIGGRVDVRGFSQILENFKASYFAGAIMLPEDGLLEDIRAWFAKDRWEPETL
ncbi:MAG: helix-turn-helix domain-containing protein, partial [Luteibaculum sp.]